MEMFHWVSESVLFAEWLNKHNKNKLVHFFHRDHVFVLHTNTAVYSAVYKCPKRHIVHYTQTAPCTFGVFFFLCKSLKGLNLWSRGPKFCLVLMG